ncbi:MAG: RNA 2',3'-cyclic phosphodiesterase [Ignavibacteriales bacterium]|nr:RNA 2',3'-cyclic phosphodiesterase [Ignavibacteriales bacterium]
MVTIRTFIAFDTPDPIKKEMSQLQMELKNSNADVKWEVESKFHVTIKFLGNIDESILQKVIDHCQSIVESSPRFDVVYQTLGCFPNKKHPRVIWIGCQNENGVLQKLKISLDKALLPLGFKIEDRAFHPHITLGRVRTPKGIQNLTPMLENLNFEPRKASINEILIMKSILKSEGSIYSILKTIHLQQ